MVSILAIAKRKETVTILFLVPSVIVLLDYFTGIGRQVSDALVGWASVLALFAYILGAAQLFRVHATRIQRRKPREWQLGALTLVSFVGFLLLALVPQTKPIYDYMMTNVAVPLNTAMLAVMGFYAYPIFYRGCGRVRNLDTVVLITATIFGILFNTAPAVATFPILQNIGVWIRDVPNNAGTRAITVGMGLALVQLLIRSVLGLERSYVGEVGG